MGWTSGFVLFQAQLFSKTNIVKRYPIPKGDKITKLQFPCLFKGKTKLLFQYN